MPVEILHLTILTSLLWILCAKYTALLIRKLFLQCDDNDLTKTDKGAHKARPKCIDLKLAHKILFSTHRRKHTTLPFRPKQGGVQKLLLAVIKAHSSLTDYVTDDKVIRFIYRVHEDIELHICLVDSGKFVINRLFNESQKRFPISLSYENNGNLAYLL